jgi:hypothetical protein
MPTVEKKRKEQWLREMTVRGSSRRIALKVVEKILIKARQEKKQIP